MRSALALLGVCGPCAAATDPPSAFFRGDCDHGVECDHWNQNGTTVCKPYEMGPPGSGALEVRLWGLPGDPTTVVNVITYETVAGKLVVNDKNYTVANQWTKVSLPMSGWSFHGEMPATDAYGGINFFTPGFSTTDEAEAAGPKFIAGYHGEGWSFAGGGGGSFSSNCTFAIGSD